MRAQAPGPIGTQPAVVGEPAERHSPPLTNTTDRSNDSLPLTRDGSAFEFSPTARDHAADGSAEMRAAAYHQIMLKVFLAIAALGVIIFALIDLWQVPAAGVRGGSRFLWTVAILLLPVAGAALWLLFGRLPEDGPTRRYLGPDDDPDFLRGTSP